jgi:hypothetical protein
MVLSGQPASYNTYNLGHSAHSGISSPDFFRSGSAALGILPQVFVDRFLIEWVLVGIGTFLLSSIGHYDLIPQLFGLIIGLHFLPIAKVLQLPSYYWVGSIMIAGELSSLLLPHGDIRNIVGCACIGLTLWVNGLIILTRISIFTNRRRPILY